MHRPYLTFRHWSGITPYTSSYEFAGSCVFGKQSVGNNSLRPRLAARLTLSLTYGRFFAEFLEDLSLVRLSLLDQNTCVGLRYGSYVIKLRSFSWKRAPPDSHRPKPPHLCSALIYCTDLPIQHNHGPNPNPIRGLEYNTPSLHRITHKLGNINPNAIACGFRHRLRTG